MFFMDVIAGETRSTVKKSVPFHRRARACPSPCLDREGNGFGWRAFFARVDRSRGTGPRATGQRGVLFAMRRSGSGDPELQSLIPQAALRRQNIAVSPDTIIL